MRSEKLPNRVKHIEAACIIMTFLIADHGLCDLGRLGRAQLGTRIVVLVELVYR